MNGDFCRAMRRDHVYVFEHGAERSGQGMPKMVCDERSRDRGSVVKNCIRGKTNRENPTVWRNSPAFGKPSTWAAVLAEIYQSFKSKNRIQLAEARLRCLLRHVTKP